MQISPLLLICKYVYDSNTSPPPPKKKERERKKKCWDADINTLHLHTRFLLHIMMGQKRTCTLIFFCLGGGAGEGGRGSPVLSRVRGGFPLTWSFWKRAWGWVIGFAFVFGSGITRLRLKWWRLKLKKKKHSGYILLWVTELFDLRATKSLVGHRPTRL